MSKIAEQIETIFIIADIRWRINGELVTPTVEDIDAMLNELTDVKHGTDYVSVESGKLLIKRSEGRTDLYVHISELEED